MYKAIDRLRRERSISIKKVLSFKLNTFSFMNLLLKTAIS